MSDPAAPSLGADEASGGKWLYESGPWLLLYGHGPRSESRARKIAEQCDDRGVSYEVLAVDDVEPADLAVFTALVLVLPTAEVSGPARALDRFVELVDAYRTGRPDGLPALLAGGRKWFQVGVVQVFADVTAVYPREAVELLEAAVCRVWRVTADADLNPFAAYPDGRRTSRPDPPERVHERDVADLRRIVTSWGVGWSPAEVTTVRQFVDQLRTIFEDRSYVDLRRPVPDIQRNRLDLLLDRPDYIPPVEVCPRKKWTEGGQRVVQKVLAKLSESFPTVGRPANRSGKKHLQKEFTEFYDALRVAEELLKIER